MTSWSSAQPGASIRPLRAWDYFVLNAYWFALSFLWNSMGPILLPTMVPLLVPEFQKGTALGTLSAIGLIIATIVQPAAGAWSDGRTTRWGKRRPYIVSGVMLASLFLVAMFFSQSYTCSCNSRRMSRTDRTRVTSRNLCPNTSAAR